MYCNSTEWSLVQPLSQLSLPFLTRTPLLECCGEKKLILRFLNFDVWREGRLSVRTAFLFPSVFRESDFYVSEQCYFFILKYQSKTIRGTKNVPYDAQLCPIILLVGQGPHRDAISSTPKWPLK
jgi:hypothetical protein